MVRNSPIQIRPIHKLVELKAVEELQREIWDCSDLEVLPSLALIPLLDIGGVLIGAYEGETLIGFVLGFPGFEAGKPILHSDMLAVKPAYRSEGLGYKLKLAQRQVALANGIEKITWTFDPLQSANAHLNFGKLGVIADRYKINYYGETSSSLHRAGTDRLWVSWLLKSERVQSRISSEPIPPFVSDDRSNLLKVGEGVEPVSCSLDKRNASVTIEIPGDINGMMKADIKLARRWREATRAAFTPALAANYFVKDFSRTTRDEQQVGVYLLTMNRNDE